MRRFMVIAALVIAVLPAGSRAQTSTDTTTSEFMVSGLRVILRRNTATDVIAANLYLLGGSRQLTPETQGIEALLFAAAERGSRKFPGPRLRQELVRVGSQINVR